MNSLHITIVHDRPIPAVKYGGTERILWWLAQALVARGNRITFIAPEGSFCDFSNVVIRPPHSTKISHLIPRNCDIVHSFSTLHEQIPKPLIVTIGGNGQPGEKFHPNTVFVSKDHARRHGSAIYVHNGLNPDDYPLPGTEKKNQFCYFLAKASWKVKNVRGAIRIAKEANFPIKIMGGFRPSLSKKVSWLGMIGGGKKMDILRKGSALLFPVRWHEPFGIAIIEALLTGSPVFGTPYGSLPELVNEEAGVLSNRADVLSQALLRHENFDREVCRNYVLSRFTHNHMAESYLELYEHIISGKSLSEKEAETISKNPPEKLLDFF